MNFLLKYVDRLASGWGARQRPALSFRFAYHAKAFTFAREFKGGVGSVKESIDSLKSSYGKVGATIDDAT